MYAAAVLGRASAGASYAKRVVKALVRGHHRFDGDDVFPTVSVIVVVALEDGPGPVPRHLHHDRLRHPPPAGVRDEAPAEVVEPHVGSVDGIPGPPEGSLEVPAGPAGARAPEHEFRPCRTWNAPERLETAGREVDGPKAVSSPEARPKRVQTGGELGSPRAPACVAAPCGRGTPRRSPAELVNSPGGVRPGWRGPDPGARGLADMPAIGTSLASPARAGRALAFSAAILRTSARDLARRGGAAGRWRVVGEGPGSRSPCRRGSSWPRGASAGVLGGGGASSRGDSRPREESSIIPGQTQVWRPTGGGAARGHHEDLRSGHPERSPPPPLDNPHWRGVSSSSRGVQIDPA